MHNDQEMLYHPPATTNMIILVQTQERPVGSIVFEALSRHTVCSKL